MNERIEIKGLTKMFQQHPALDDISLNLEENHIYGLLGRNGAGKTTLLNMVTNRLFPTSGRVLIDGEDAAENDRAQSKVYYMGEKNYLPETTTVKQLFEWTGDFYPGFDRDYALELAKKFDLNVKKKLKNLSTGYLTIAKLITALATDVPYLLFDEPVLGLDANHRELFYRELLENYAKKPRVIVISTHLIEEVADIIDQVIIKQGKIILDKPAEEVRRMGYSVSGKAAEVDSYCQGKDVLSVESLGGLKTAALLGTPVEVPAGMEVTVLDMQKLFVRLTNV